MLGPNVRDLDILVGAKMPAVLDRVHQQFAESQPHGVGFALWQISNLVHELDEPLRGHHIASGREANPVRRRRQNLNAVVPNCGPSEAACTASASEESENGFEK